MISKRSNSSRMISAHLANYIDWNPDFLVGGFEVKSSEDLVVIWRLGELHQQTISASERRAEDSRQEQRTQSFMIHQP